MAMLLFKTDHHHSRASKELIGVYTNKAKYHKVIKKLIKDDIQSDSGRMDKEEENRKISYQIGLLLSSNQTYGMNNFELFAEEVLLNTTPYA